jgi:tartrate-resistant acid phosphatase type 5
MPDFFSEPFVHLAGLTHKSALVAWGAFYFRVKDSGKEFKLVEDDDLDEIEEVIGDDPNKPPKIVHPRRSDTIGETSKPYGPARVEVRDAAGNVVASVPEAEKNHCWVPGLAPDTEYTYKVFVTSDGIEEEWAGGPRRNWERVGSKMGLGAKNKPYRNRFRTFPDPTQPSPRPFTFAVIGDFGVGIKKDKDRGQRQIAAALERAVDDHDVRLVLTTGDNIYRTGGFLGLPVGGDTGDEDDDWFFTYYQPYRYVINRVPVYPTIGNHDSPETEGKDDRDQLVDNFYLRTRLDGETAADRASLSPGLFYRFRFGSDVEFICIDTSKEPVDGKKVRLFTVPKHKQFLERALANTNGGSPAWRIPFGHHPPFCSGPKYGDTKGMGELVKLFETAGVRLVLSGHEHFCQHNRHKDVNYFVTGGAGKIRTGDLKKKTKSEIVSWASEYHFLLVTIDGMKATVRAVAATDGGALFDIRRLAPDKSQVSEPIVINLS